MTEIRMLVQSTPNPNAKKFVVSEDVKLTGKVSFVEISDCEHIDLARELFLLANVTRIHFFENVITVTQNGLGDWNSLEKAIRRVIEDQLPKHDPDFMTAEEEKRKNMSPHLLQIEEILDRTIRPSLRMDGGDVEVISLDGDVLTIRYEGACGSCPSAQTGTLEAIRHTIHSEYRPDVEVIAL